MYVDICHTLNDKFSLWKVCSYNFIHYTHIHLFFCPGTRIHNSHLTPILSSLGSIFLSSHPPPPPWVCKCSFFFYPIFYTKLILSRFTRNAPVKGLAESNNFHCQLPFCPLRVLNGRKIDIKESLKIYLPKVK